MTSMSRPTEEATRSESWPIAEAPAGRTMGWWGMLLFILTEGAFFGIFLASYYYLRFTNTGGWPPPKDVPPHLIETGIGTGVLVLSCVPMFLAVRLARDGKRLALPMVVLTFLCAAAFVALQFLDYYGEYPSTDWSKDAYGSLFYTITGFHVVHVALGMLMLLLIVVSSLFRGVGRAQGGAVRVVAMYWYFLAVLASAIYLTVYGSPYLGSS